MTDYYEYTTVKLAGINTKAAEHDWPEILNGYARGGWRLVAVGGGEVAVAFFERPRDWSRR